MGLVELIFFLLVGIGLFVALAGLVVGARRQRGGSSGRWEVVPRSGADGSTVLELVRAGEAPLKFRELAPGTSQEAFEEALLEAELRRDSLNGMLLRR